MQCLINVQHTNKSIVSPWACPDLLILVLLVFRITPASVSFHKAVWPGVVITSIHLWERAHHPQGHLCLGFDRMRVLRAFTAPGTGEVLSGHLLTFGGWVSYQLLADLKDSWEEKLKSLLLLGFHRPQAPDSWSPSVHTSLRSVPFVHTAILTSSRLFPSLQRSSGVQAFPCLS